MGTLWSTYGMLAACSFDADAAAAAFRVQRGFAAAFVRNGVGDYTFTLTDGAALATETVCQMTLNAAAGGMCAVEVLTTTTLRTRTLTSAAAAADTDFWLQIQKIAP